MTTTGAPVGATPPHAGALPDIGPVPPTVTVRGTVPGGLDAAADGSTAAALAELYDAARTAVVAAAGADGGGVLIVVETDEPRHGSMVEHALGAMCRSLAREYGRHAVRVNAALVSGSEPTALLEFVASPAAVLLTGAVFDTRRSEVSGAAGAGR